MVAGGACALMITPPSRLTLAEEIRAERDHFHTIIDAFKSYGSFVRGRMNRLAEAFHHSLTPEQQALATPEYLAKLEAITKAAMVNQRFFDMILQKHQCLYDDDDDNDNEGDDQAIRRCTVQITDLSTPHLDSLSSTLRQIVRDWAEEGRAEREACYKPILNLLTAHFSDENDFGKIRILVPGAGLGRLAFEIAQRGFQCQGNEFSHYMLLTAQFILNSRDLLNHQMTIHPYILPLSNNRSVQDQLRPISFPDCSPSSVEGLGDFSMIAGDFVQVYGHQDEDDEEDDGLAGSFDSIVTCFFLDTAKNVIEYLQIFHRLLRPGGAWINLGPLLYHFEGSRDELSIELSMDEIVQVAQRIGFLVASRDDGAVRTGYVQNTLSMHQTVYECSLTKFIKTE